MKIVLAGLQNVFSAGQKSVAVTQEMLSSGCLRNLALGRDLPPAEEIFPAAEKIFPMADKNPRRFVRDCFEYSCILFANPDFRFAVDWTSLSPGISVILAE